MTDVKKDYMDDLEIFELRIGSMDGLSIRVGGGFSIKSKQMQTTAIIKVYVDGSKEYHIFAKEKVQTANKRGYELIGDDQLIKVVDGIPCYYTVDI